MYRTDPHNGHTKLDIRHPAHMDHGGGAQVWRLSWNVTGTVLASSGDDGCVCLWKGTCGGRMCVERYRHYLAVEYANTGGHYLAVEDVNTGGHYLAVEDVNTGGHYLAVEDVVIIMQRCRLNKDKVQYFLLYLLHALFLDDNDIQIS